jgi:AcrR family transcriptional regulator
MAKATPRSPRRDTSLSRAQIIDASIDILDHGGEGGLTFRALAERLATGPGAIYGHIADKRDLLTAACDAVVARALAVQIDGASPHAVIRDVALGMFDAMDSHPWVGSALIRAAGQLPMLRVLERLGQQLQLLGVPADAQWTTVSALLSYIVGVGGQNAANSVYARTEGLDRTSFLDGVATAWAGLDPDVYPFTRRMAGQLRVHDDRIDFVAGIDLILGGIERLRALSESS